MSMTTTMILALRRLRFIKQSLIGVALVSIFVFITQINFDNNLEISCDNPYIVSAEDELILFIPVHITNKGIKRENYSRTDLDHIVLILDNEKNVRPENSHWDYHTEIDGNSTLPDLFSFYYKDLGEFEFMRFEFDNGGRKYCWKWHKDQIGDFTSNN